MRHKDNCAIKESTKPKAGYLKRKISKNNKADERKRESAFILASWYKGSSLYFVQIFKL